MSVTCESLPQPAVTSTDTAASDTVADRRTRPIRLSSCGIRSLHTIGRPTWDCAPAPVTVAIATMVEPDDSGIAIVR
ncbi:hypothetical protein GCM10023094_14200 [Rhodococcus olei]|uniref:Uncharacterized protein n=1 Tax=Rhodococcus olei TaxID=2161675 RepID=A0ABP8NZ35_9NOCA